QRMVYDAEEAVGAAESLGYPVVVKPLDSNHGRGVSINLKDDEQVRIGFEKAYERASTGIVETYQAGHDYRSLVVDGKVVAVSQRGRGHVVGDGKHTIAELVETVNTDPRRGVGHEKVLTRLELDHQAQRLLEAAGKTEGSVLPEGEVFSLRSTGNLSTGGT